MDNTGLRIKKIRQLLKKSQQELANELGVTKQAISNIENNKCAPGLNLLSKLLIDYNVNCNFIIAGVGSVFINDKESNKSLRLSILNEVEQMLDARGIN